MRGKVVSWQYHNQARKNDCLGIRVVVQIWIRAGGFSRRMFQLGYSKSSHWTLTAFHAKFPVVDTVVNMCNSPDIPAQVTILLCWAGICKGNLVWLCYPGDCHYPYPSAVICYISGCFYSRYQILETFHSRHLSYLEYPLSAFKL